MTIGGGALTAPIHGPGPTPGTLMFQDQGSNLIRQNLMNWGPQGINGLEVKGGMPPGFGDPAGQKSLIGALGGDGDFTKPGGDNPLASLMGGAKGGADKGAGIAGDMDLSNPNMVVVALLKVLVGAVEAQAKAQMKPPGPSMSDLGEMAGKQAALGPMAGMMGMDSTMGLGAAGKGGASAFQTAGLGGKSSGKAPAGLNNTLTGTGGSAGLGGGDTSGSEGGSTEA